MTFELKGQTIYVAGHRGMVGSAILRRLKAEQCSPLSSARELDLR